MEQFKFILEIMQSRVTYFLLFYVSSFSLKGRNVKGRRIVMVSANYHQKSATRVAEFVTVVADIICIYQL